MSKMEMMKFVVTPECAVNGQAKKTGKPWRRQDIMVHVKGEVRRLTLRFLGANDSFMQEGEYRLAPDAIYVGPVHRKNDDGSFNTEDGLRVSMRTESFVRIPVTAVPSAKAA